MKKLILYFLLCIFLFHSFEVVVVYIKFKINQDYIAEVLCINKDVPESNCNGCCQLKKEIEEKEQQKTEQKIVLEEKQLWFVEELPTLIRDCFLKKEKRRWLRSDPFKCNPRVFDIFHPPRV